MNNVYDGNHIEADLRKLPDEEADLIDAFLDELTASDRALNVLLKRCDEYHDPTFNVRAIDCLLNRGYNISRIRPLTPRLGKYRIIFALDNRSDDFHLLAVVKKKKNLATTEIVDDEYNYEPNHPITTRICAEYDQLGLPVLNG